MPTEIVIVTRKSNSICEQIALSKAARVEKKKKKFLKNKNAIAHCLISFRAVGNVFSLAKDASFQASSWLRVSCRP